MNLPPRPRHVVAVVAGTALEFYDFLTYAFFAVQIGKALFPDGQSHGLLPALATFGAGFLMRPVGAAVIGRIADKAGRKPAMLLSFGLMGLSVLGLALIPPYAVIGMAAPILAVICRLVQGFALGGEVGPSTAFLLEAAPAGRRTRYVAFQYVGQQTAVLVSGLVGLLLSSLLTAGQLDAWGWRAAFVVGAIIVPFALILRRELAETLPERREARAASAVRLDRRMAGLAVLGLLILAGGTTVTYVLNYLNTYATTTLRMAAKAGFTAVAVKGLAGIVFNVIGASIADRYGKRWVMILPWMFLLVVILPGFAWVSEQRTTTALLLLTFALASASALSSPVAFAWLTEALPPQTRAGSLGLIYAFAISVFGGSTQYMAAWLTRATGSPLAPAWYMMAGVAVGLTAMIAAVGLRGRRVDKPRPSV
jgi:MFS family permease